MKKIININLHGRVIPIEDAAYDALQRYIESLRRYFAKEEGRDEIINDIESRMAELMNDRIRKGAAVITEYDVNDIINSMGRIEDFEAADADSTTTGTTAADSNAYSQGTGKQSRPRFSGRLYRDDEDKFIGGVCAGIAAYTNIDPTVVRLLFAIITFGGFGLGFLIYLVLWIVLPASRVERYSGKRFFRNPDDRILGGVAGGLAAYFNKRPWTIRLIFAAPILLNVFVNIVEAIFDPYDGRFGLDLASGSLTGTFILAYIVLWIVLPEAKTPYDKMEMRGEKVDVNRIRQNVQEGVGERAKAWGEEVKAAGQRMTDRAKEFTRTQGADFASDFRRSAAPVGRGIGHAIGVLFKAFFLFVAGVIAFFLFVLVLVFTFGGVAQPVNDFLIDGTWQRVFLWGTVILFLAVPLIGIITWIIRRAMNVRSQNRYLGWTFSGLWTLGWVCLFLFVSSAVKDFRYTEQTESEIQLANASLNKMTVKAPEPGIRYTGDFGWFDVDEDANWDINEDSLKLSNVRIEVGKSDDSFYHVTLRRYSDGASRAKALQRAEKIAYSVRSLDSVLSVGSGFAVSSAEKYRDQKVMVEIKVPVGRQIRFDRTVGEKLNAYDIRVSESENYGRRRNWGRRRWEVDWDNNSYEDWKTDTDYYMTAEGRLKEVGIPDVEEPKEEREEKETKNDSLKRELQRRLDSLEQTGREESDGETTEPQQETTRTSNKRGLPTPNALAFVPTIF